MKLRLVLPLLITTTFLIIAPCAVLASDLGSQTEEALLRALDDERHAQALYQAVMDRHGEIRPFVHIIEAERRHESMLLVLLEKHNVQIPANPWPERPTTVSDTVREACAQAVTAERANIALYDELLKQVTEPEIRSTFNRLREASKERHLPAFERCTTSNRGRGPGKGRHHGPSR